MNKIQKLGLWVGFTGALLFVVILTLLLSGCDSITGTDGAEYIVDCSDPFNHCGQWGSGGP